MGKKGGDTRVNRQMAPAFWDIKRKHAQFVVRVRPGPHPKHRSYPLGMILRDVLKVVNTMQESRRVLVEGKVKVDGVVRRDPNLAVGLMDVIELSTGQTYRMVPKDSMLLTAIAIDKSESNVKLAKVTSKTTIKGKKLQYGFHDGKTIITDQKFNVGDSCLMQLPEVQIKSHIAFEKAATALIILGDNAGRIGKIDKIQDGIFSLPTRALISYDDKSVEMPVEMVMAVGPDKPVIKVS
ncbi:MAG: 30S ribosomal protein S4e [Nitrososphaera sp.]